MLNDSNNDGSKFATKKWYVIESQTTKGKYNQNKSIKFETESIKSRLCDYSDAFILVAGDTTVAASNNTDVAFKNCASFSTCKTDINDMFVDEANHIYIAMLMYNLIEPSDNYSGTSGSLWRFKRDEVPVNNANLSVDNSQSFKSKAALIGKTTDAVNNTNRFVKNTNIVVPLKYLSNFWRSLEMPLIKCKIHLELNWIENHILSSDRDSEKCKIMDAKLHAPRVTLPTKDNVNLTKQLNDGFKRSVSWNNYQTILAKVIEKGKNIYELLSASFQGFKRLFVLDYFIVANDANNKAGMKNNKKYFLPRGEINNYNVLIDERNCYDQPDNDLIK